LTWEKIWSRGGKENTVSPLPDPEISNSSTLSDNEGRLFPPAKRLPNKYRIFTKNDIEYIKKAWSKRRNNNGYGKSFRTTQRANPKN
jgi:hypothetical protein